MARAVLEDDVGTGVPLSSTSASMWSGREEGWETGSRFPRPEAVGSTLVPPCLHSSSVVSPKSG